MDRIKICVIGNSVALRIRPRDEGAKVYSLILKDLMEAFSKKEVVVCNLSISRLLTEEVVDNKEYYLDNGQDITIVNLGCVDAPTREIPLWFSDIIFKRRGMLLYTVFNPVYRHIISRIRPTLVKLRGYTPWVTIDRFENNIKTILSNLEGKGEIMVLGINPGNQRVEEQLSKTLARYSIYNEVLFKACEDNGVNFISTRDLKSKKYFPDGVHYNRAGHELIAEKIFNKLNFSEL